MTEGNERFNYNSNNNNNKKKETTMALQNKNTFQKSGTCRKNLEVRQDYNSSFIIIITINIIIIVIVHWVIWSAENMTLDVATPVCVVLN